MFLGIVSDSHDDMDFIGKAVGLLNERGVSHVIHGGDITSPFTFEVFMQLNCTLTGIFGNNDGDKLLLKEKSGGNFFHQPYLLTLHGKRVIVVHEPDLVDALADSRHFDLIIYGHTHKADVRRVGNSLVVNPGKVARLHKGDATVAILDMTTMEAEIMHLG